MKKQQIQQPQTNLGEVIAVAALAGAAAAGAVIAIYEVLKSEKGKAGVAKAKHHVVKTAGKVKNGVVNTAGKVKSKLPGRKQPVVVDACELDFDEETLAEEAAVEEIDLDLDLDDVAAEI